MREDVCLLLGIYARWYTQKQSYEGASAASIDACELAPMGFNVATESTCGGLVEAALSILQKVLQLHEIMPLCHQLSLQCLCVTCCTGRSYLKIRSRTWYWWRDAEKWAVGFTWPLLYDRKDFCRPSHIAAVDTWPMNVCEHALQNVWPCGMTCWVFCNWTGQLIAPLTKLCICALSRAQ